MKTKSLLLTAALSAAGIASSLAQVYSVNVVGYINVDIQPGLNLVTAQLTGTNNSINTVLATTTPVMSDNSLLFTWNSGAQTFNNAQVYGSGQWYDPDTGALSTATISPGQAAFINNVGTASKLLVVGTVPTGTLPVTVSQNLGLYGDPAPVSQNIATNGFPIDDNDLLFSWNVAGQTYNNALVGAGPQSGGPAWFDPNTGNPANYAPAVGEGFVVNHLGATATWNRSFTVQ